MTDRQTDISRVDPSSVFWNFIFFFIFFFRGGGGVGIPIFLEKCDRHTDTRNNVWLGLSRVLLRNKYVYK